jgi:circadian clock protein KaiC
MSSLLEGLIVMRYAEVEGRICRLLGITKVRDSDFDPFLHEFSITDQGIKVGGVLTGLEAILSGYAREPAALPASPRSATDSEE